MNSIVGVRFKKTGKLYFYEAIGDDEIALGTNVLAVSERGEEIGRVVKHIDSNMYNDKENLSKIIRIATKSDIEKVKENEEKAQLALKYCKEQVKELQLNMKILAAEYTFDTSKLVIYFVSEDRVDFRELVKNLASKYRARIELRQIGPRDEVKSYPNLGMCGKETCCRTFLQDFEPVTIKMAKEQGLQINMAKLSGACGKLMCCLKYEENVYKENLKKLPKVGEMVKVSGENELGKVTSVDILGLQVRIRFGTTHDDERYEVVPVEKIKWEKKNQDNKE